MLPVLLLSAGCRRNSSAEKGSGFLTGDRLVKHNGHFHRQHKALCAFFELLQFNFQLGA